ncbi:UNVERIFIED_CONTAM: hypothetical protein RMT77_017338 [Armadillidium vulgare]|nr:cytochrome c oxidase assembly factor 6-like protein [Armadillidium vulgare]
MPREEGEKKSAFPNKEARYICWNSRDDYWKCIDSDGNCESLRKIFEEKCPPIWVKHFDRRKQYLDFKEKLKDGYEPLSDENNQKS